MIRELFERKASPEAELIAEAQALLDDGLDLPFVLGLFPDDADWLEPLLETSTGLAMAYEGDPASYYFEASLKSKFLGAATEPKPVIPVVLSAPAYSPVRTAIATMSVATTAAVLGILSLGFITADDSVPGDWNYAFKLANERFEYTTSRGDSRIDVQFRQAEERIHELKQKSDRGDLSESQFERVQREFLELARRQDLDAARRAQLEYMAKSATTAMNDAAAANPDLVVPAAAAAAAIVDSVATPLVAPLPTVSPTPATTVAPTPTATAEPSASPAATETPTPPATPTEATTTPSPSVSPSGTAEPTGTSLPSELESPTVSPSATP